MIQHLILTLEGKRKIVVLEYTAQEYGISEQSFWSCWIADEKVCNGDADTLEEAFRAMLRAVEYRGEMQRISESLRKSLSDTFIAGPAVG